MTRPERIPLRSALRPGTKLQSLFNAIPDVPERERVSARLNRSYRSIGAFPTGSYNSTVTMFGQISRTLSARSWMQMNGRKPLKISVSEMCGGATDFR